MEDRNEKTTTPHLNDPELFTLALPPAGEPEALPRHLSECLACSRALQEWKLAVRETANEEIEELSRRTPAEWEGLENQTIEAMRRARRGGSSPVVRWGLAAAAALMLGFLLLPARKPERAPAAGAASILAMASAQDQSDDALLRDVARLSRGEDAASWSGLAPEPSAAAADEEVL